MRGRVSVPFVVIVSLLSVTADTALHTDQSYLQM
jgi:hypothetical protein